MAPSGTAGLGPSGSLAGGDAGPLAAGVARAAGRVPEVEGPRGLPQQSPSIQCRETGLEDGVLRARFPEQRIFFPNTVFLPQLRVCFECSLMASCPRRPSLMM